MNIPDGYRGIVYLMRGTSNSGKSHLALRLAGGDPDKVMGADAWFDMQPGGYLANWKPELLFNAHRWNQHRVREAMRRGVTPVVVDNTNLTIKEARPYVEFATPCQYWVEIREADSPWWLQIAELLKNKQLNQVALAAWATKLAEGFAGEGLAIPKNIHGVPAATMLRCFQRYHAYTVEDVCARIKLGAE